MGSQPSDRMELERVLGRLLSAGTYLAVVLIGVGVAGLVLAGRSPLDPDVAPFDPGRLPADLAAGRAEGFLWLGIIVAVATPAARVGAALAGYALRRERIMAAVSVAVLAVIALAVLLALGTG